MSHTRQAGNKIFPIGRILPYLLCYGDRIDILQLYVQICVLCILRIFIHSVARFGHWRPLNMIAWSHQQNNFAHIVVQEVRHEHLFVWLEGEENLKKQRVRKCGPSVVFVQTEYNFSCSK